MSKFTSGIMAQSLNWRLYHTCHRSRALQSLKERINSRTPRGSTGLAIMSSNPVERMQEGGLINDPSALGKQRSHQDSGGFLAVTSSYRAGASSH